MRWFYTRLEKNNCARGHRVDGKGKYGEKYFRQYLFDSFNQEFKTSSKITQ